MKLKDWQKIKLFDPCLAALRQENVALCAGATGSGKSCIAMELIKAVEKPALYVAPKSTITAMRRTADLWGAPLLDVVNIEKLRTGNTPYATKHGSQYVWNLDPEKHMLVIDEAHCVRGGDKGTLNSALLKATNQLVKTDGRISQYTLPTLLMSATMAESPLHLRDAIGYRLGFHNLGSHANAWLKTMGCYVRELKTIRGTRYFYEFPKGTSEQSKEVVKAHLERLSRLMYPRFGAFLAHKDIPGFPEAEIIVDLYDIDPKDVKVVQAAYDELAMKEGSAEALTARLFARERAELCKLGIFRSMTENMVAEGNNVIVFVNFLPTFHKLRSMLKGYNPAVIYGNQKENRDEEMRRFNNDETNVIIVMIQAGGVGVELHDGISGTNPRVALVSPNDSATLFVQALGRPVRLTTRQKVRLYIILAAKTAEEKVYKNLKNKLDNLTTLNDEDLIL